MIDLNEVSKNYGAKKVISEVSLPITEEKLTAFIGPNGAGKSTLLSMISRLISIDSGQIYLDHNEVKAWRSNELSKKLSILKQSNGVNLRITVRELVGFGRFPYSKGRMTAEDQDMIDYALEKLGLVEMADEMIDTLSGGQLQRAYIAMILAQDTEYILLDEPLNNLDMNHAVLLMKTLRRLVEEEHKTILLVIHDINFAATYADEIVAMKNGAIFAHGTMEEMIQPHILNALYDMEIKICELDGKRFCMYFN
ncbi:ATP-binding cassette domain-containing protein [Enterococcus hulanensis]|uniref:ATP-binding cassette domain-containing protein n=1 Tax=Enterococcus hulanensis TaxID=2559929 RepID=A0ABU3F1Y6_9ENTE|nr:ATP-binding cassette domain-containing protein [Enterococcus hulanensis]MDT2601147.1 ATP-binding cassette domain-containing protein [Enterococcus hulanensis]MDT2610371.1 ATP-binding cassette domain-containing protein [Enterococcus hulanensis]MDT2617098.1 ATP-binding cassette domain-containing protein [Enterococcus hulanensis]MDT2628382.1 ATP-binding cassette domain-containing protein [Enterococcus hulanensis]MDT2655487.1 ATP-binding cassette domain-containing protein [Enterococcus hulanensi